MTSLPRNLEEFLEDYGYRVVVEDNDDTKIMSAGSGAYGVDFNGKPKKGIKKPSNGGFMLVEDDEITKKKKKALFIQDEYDSHDIEFGDNEIKALTYIDDVDDLEFELIFPQEKDDESAEELKVLFDVGFAFAKRALTGKRKNKLKKEYKDISDDTETKVAPCWDGYVQVGMKKGKSGRMVPNCVAQGKKSAIDVCCPEDSEVETKAAKKKLRDPKGGLTAAGRAHFKKKEGANLKPGVKGAADTPDKMRRKGSFLTRFFTNPSGPMKDEKGRPTRLALSASAWGEAVPQDASDAAALAAKGRKMLERYESAKKKDACDDVEVKSLGPTIGATGNTSDQDMVDRDSDGVIFDGTPDEKPTPNRKPYKKMPNSYLEKRRRRKVERDLKAEGIKPTKGRRIVPEEDDEGQIQNQIYGRSEREINARSRARETFDQNEDKKRFVRNQLRKQGVTANAKKEDRDDNERAARKAARAEYDRRVRDGEPKKAKPTPGPTPPTRKLPDGYVPGKPADRYPSPKVPKIGKPADRYDDPPRRSTNRAEEERMQRLRPNTIGKPADRYDDDPRRAPDRAEKERQERMRPADTSNQRAEDARNRAKRPAMRPADRYDDPGPAPSNRAEEERQGRMRPADNSNQRTEDARNRAKRPQRPADRYEKPRPSNPKRPRGYSQGDVV